MRKSFFLVIVMVFTVVFSCKKSNIDNGKINIVSTINPYYLIVKQIGGQKLNSSLLIPAGASPHSFSPSPSDIKKLEQASLVVANGFNLEKMFENKFDEIKEKVIYVSAAMPEEMLLNLSHEGESVENLHEHEGHDPHIWLDPYNVAIIAQYITDKIIELDQDNKEYYLNNLMQLNDELELLDKKIFDERKGFKSTEVVVLHNSFNYFFERYDINSVADIERAPGKIPTPKDLASIGESLAGKSANVILIQPQFSRKSADIIAGEFHLAVDIVDQLGFYINSKSIGELILKNWNIMKKHFETQG